MKNTRIFVLRHLYFDTLRDYFNNSFCEDNPVGPVPFLTEGIGTVSQPPHRALLFTHTKATPYVLPHRNHHTHRTVRPLRQTRLGASSPICPPTTRSPTNGVRSGQYFSLRAPGVHLPGMRQNQFPHLREKVSNQSGGLFSGTQTRGQKLGNPVWACRKRAGRLHGLIC